MNFFKFLFTKAFLKHALLSVALVVVLCFVYLFWLDYYTNHDQRIEVPNLAKMDVTQVQNTLEELDLRMKMIDSTSYNPNFPPKSVIEQDPLPGKFVKENRQIYIKLNPSGYGNVQVPNLVYKTRRQAEPTLKALGFKIGKVTYQPNIAKDMVLELRYKGKKLNSGTALKKTSTIDLVLGDGNRPGSSSESDTDATDN